MKVQPPRKLNHAEYRRQAKAAASAKLNERGIDANEFEAVASLVSKAAGSGLFKRKLADESETQYLMRISTEHIVDQSAIALARTPPKFSALEVAPHPRAAEIDAAQPPVRTPCGTGNWPEHSKVWTR